MGYQYKDDREYEQHQKRKTEGDREQQAIDEGTTPERVEQGNVTGGTLASSSSAQTGAAPRSAQGQDLQDGYALNEGSEYQPPHQDELEQEDYDPTHSGVRSAHNKPGTRTNSPGREGQTGWAEQMEMGETTDTRRRKNPAD